MNLNDVTKEKGDQQAGGRKRAVPRREFLRGAVAGAGAGLVAGGLAYKAATALGSSAAINPKGFSRARPIVTDTVLPQSVDVAIIGGGFAGTSTALALAERGVSVALFEKGVIAGEASGRSGGLVEAMFGAPQKMELVEYSKQRWRQMKTLTGEENGFLQAGTTALFAREEDVAQAESWVESVKGLPNGQAHMLSAAEAAALVPGATVKLAGGITCPGDGAAEPTLAAPGFALGARKLGAKIYQFCAVRGIERSGGRVSAVVTEKGRVAASTVVLTGGVWTQMMGHDLGLDIPTVQCFAGATSLMPFTGPDYGAVTITAQSILGWRKQFDGGYIAYGYEGVAPLLPEDLKWCIELIPALEANGPAMRPRFNLSTFWRWLPRWRPVPLDRPGPYERTRIYEPVVRVKALDADFAHLQRVMPIFEYGAIRDQWAGALQMAVDGMPIMSTVDSIPGLILGTAFFWGLTQGPGAGLILADLAMGKKPAIDTSLFRFSRFTDGTKLQYYP